MSDYDYDFDGHFRAVERQIERTHKRNAVIGAVILCAWIVVATGVVFAVVKIAPLLMRILEKAAS